MTKLSIAAKTQYKYLNPLFGIFITLQFICDILVLRIITLHGVTFTASSLIFCLNFALIDIIANVYGMSSAKKLAYTNFFCQILVAVLLYLSLFNFDPSTLSNQDYARNAADLKNYGLIIASNTLFIPFAVLVGNLSNSFLMAISKYIFCGRFIALRSLLCSLIGAFLMLSISYTKIYWGYDCSFILKLVISSMLIKTIGAVILMFPVQLISNIFKVSEGVDVYDLKFKFLEIKRK